jgi:hypothetical protein
MIFYIPIVFILELIMSYLLNSGAIAILSKRPSMAAGMSILTNICTWATFYIVAKVGDWSPVLMICAATGDICGDYLTAAREPKALWKWINRSRRTKKKVTGKYPKGVTTA